MNQDFSSNAVRIDKWLWAVRLFKTRALALDACKGGHVKMEGRNLKPAHTVRIGEIYEVQRGEQFLRVRVKSIVHQRVGAALVPDLIEDLSPARPAEQIRIPAPPPRARGSGRPTKRDRRLLDAFFDPPPGGP